MNNNLKKLSIISDLLVFYNLGNGVVPLYNLKSFYSLTAEEREDILAFLLKDLVVLVKNDCVYIGEEEAEKLRKQKDYLYLEEKEQFAQINASIPSARDLQKIREEKRIKDRLEKELTACLQKAAEEISGAQAQSPIFFESSFAVPFSVKKEILANLLSLGYLAKEIPNLQDKLTLEITIPDCQEHSDSFLP